MGTMEKKVELYAFLETNKKIRLILKVHIKHKNELLRVDKMVVNGSMLQYQTLFDFLKETKICDSFTYFIGKVRNQNYDIDEKS